jgi:hypothetical protein
VEFPKLTSSASILIVTAAVIALIVLLPKVIRQFRRSLLVGDRIRIRGGHEEPPQWLQGKPEITGCVTAFLPDTDDRSAVEVKLDAPLVLENRSYNFALLRLRFADARWAHHEIVNVELWMNAPSHLRAEPARSIHHEWVESHAAYQVIA